MLIFGIDSGMDLVAGVLVDTSRCPGPLPRDLDGFARAAHGFAREVRVSTSPRHSTVERCRQIRDGLRAEVPAGLDVVLIEVPRIDGRYRRNEKLGENEIVADLSKLNRSIGAISASVDALLVLEVAAPANSKEARRAVVNAALRAAGKAEIRNGDVVDAAYHTLHAAAAVLRTPTYFASHVFGGKLYESPAAAAGARRKDEERQTPRARRGPAQPRKAR
jgi:hypothetical protein